MRQQFFSIGWIAKKYGISLRTLRFYEDKGFLKPTKKGSERLYNLDDQVRLELILKGKKLGFSLREIASLLISRTKAQNDLNASATGYLSLYEVRDQIDHLERRRAELNEAIKSLYAIQTRMKAVNDGT